jgi:hypothetical protein
MDQKELLEALSGLSARYEQHRSYVEKARTQLASGKFNAAVVEKVIFDHETKAALVVDEARPLLPRFHARVSELEADKAAVHASKGGVDEQVQELELRNAIGELSDADFEKAVGDMRETVNTANARIAVIDADLSTLTAAVERWTVLVGPDNVPAASAPAAAPAPAVPAEPVGAHANLTDIVDELFDTGTSSTPVVDEEIAIEASEAIDDGASGGPSLDIDFSLDADADIDLGKAAPVEPAPVEAAPVEAAPVEVVSVDAAPAADEPLRRALLLYREGTAEEQIYPFTGDILTIGRGRPPADGSDRHIQIKNDSKVSRIHCSLYRRGNNFYIEDGHVDETGQHKPSANNTFVNEEVVRERRLFGGELISIGDPDQTYFRFRIME